MICGKKLATILFKNKNQMVFNKIIAKKHSESIEQINNILN